MVHSAMAREHYYRPRVRHLRRHRAPLAAGAVTAGTSAAIVAIVVAAAPAVAAASVGPGRERLGVVLLRHRSLNLCACGAVFFKKN